MNLREFWAAEAAKLRDTSALLDISNLSSLPTSKENVMSLFQVNIIIMSKLIFNKVKFGSNGERNAKGFYDKRFWETNGPVGLKLKVGANASSAMYSIINNTSGTQTLDCAQYVEAVRLGAMLITDGESIFNQQFKTGLVFRSHESTGNEIDRTYLRTMVDTFDMDRYFAIDNDPNKIIFDAQEKLLSQAPIGSRITVTNFTIHEILNYKNTTATAQQKQQALKVRQNGWEHENMIKIGNNEYAGFGLGHGVGLDFIRNGVLNEHSKIFYPTPTEKKDLLKKMAVSQIAIFKRN